MKLAFVVYNDFLTPRVMHLMKATGIDYYTRWDHATGKGPGTEPHLGAGSYASTNSVLMIAFEENAPLDSLIDAITHANQEVQRADDKIRLFQLPLERIV